MGTIAGEARCTIWIPISGLDIVWVRGTEDQSCPAGFSNSDLHPSLAMVEEARDGAREEALSNLFPLGDLSKPIELAKLQNDIRLDRQELLDEYRCT